MLENWLCDSDLDNPIGIDRVLTEKDLLADSYSDCLEASSQDEKEFLLLKVISTLPELSCLICSMVFKIVETDASNIGYEYLKGTSNSLLDYLTRIQHLLTRRKEFRKRIQVGSTRAIIKKDFTLKIWVTNLIWKPKQQDGSSTQLVATKPEPSTQKPSKNQTLKQTKANYAFPIETLLAFQEIDLTKLPKKTWADIASESNDESEIDLKTLIQKTKESKVVCNISKGEQTLTLITQRATPTPKSTNTYIYKNKFSTVLQMEPEYWDKNPFKAIAKAFPLGFHFKPTAINKTRTFYEFILIDSNSVSIKHFKDPNDPLLNTHSTIQILKYLLILEVTPIWIIWMPGTKYFGIKTTNTRIHGLFTSRQTQSIIFQIGSFNEIFLEQVQQGFAQFHKMFNYQESRIPADLKYFSNFSLYSKTKNNKQYSSLQRHAFFKWWNQFDASKAEPDKVKIWFKAHPKFLKATIWRLLYSSIKRSNSKEHLTKNLKEVLKLLQSQEDTYSPENDDDFYQNEYDCFDPRNLNLLTEQDNQTHEVTPKHNLFDEEVRFEEINQNMDDWSIP
ncbi:hypothetical protein GmHk_07G019604 [Glycine max]|nr:hypothetical protein GmHk_07G019604 [Glycine max]